MPWHDSVSAFVSVSLPSMRLIAVFKQEFQHDINQSVSDRKDHPGFIPFKHNHMCFQASVWGSLNLHYVQLTRVMRQADAEFVGYLMDIRQGGPKCAVSWAGKTALGLGTMHVFAYHSHSQPTLVMYSAKTCQARHASMHDTHTQAK